MVAVPAGLCKVLAQLAVRQRLCIQAGIGAGLIQRHRIKGCKDADIRQDGCIVLAVAVAVGADVLHQRNMEAGTACAYGSRVLGHFAVQHLIGAVALRIDSVKVAGTDAAAAALALGLVNDGLVVCIVGDGIGAALLGAAVAAAAQALLHLRVSGGVLYHLARARAAAHADVLESTAEAGGFVALEMGQADKDICVHDGAADFCRLAVFAVRHRHLCFIGAAQAVRNDDLTAGGHGPEAVQLGTGEVLQCVLAAARIQGVAVGQKRQTALLLAQVSHHLGVVGAQECQIAQLTEMHLDGNEFAIHINVLDAGSNAHAAQLVQQAGAHGTAEICIIDLGCFHSSFLHFVCTARCRILSCFVV